jgi:hypothetical protein
MGVFRDQAAKEDRETCRTAHLHSLGDDGKRSNVNNPIDIHENNSVFAVRLWRGLKQQTSA